ncbi:hypothetical protein vseg_014704 [Gypsophila vaccaria]
MKACYDLLSIVLPLLVLSLSLCGPTLRHSAASAQCLGSERDALLEFKRGLKNDNCGLLDSWVSHSDCCQWNGVTCSNHTSHVIMIDLEGDDADSRCLEGELSPSLAQLNRLSYLALSYNNLEGAIPIEFRNMSSLQHLELYENHFHGDVTEVFTKLCSLEELYLGANNFTEELQHVIQALLSCENRPLELLDLSRNQFRGVVPDSISSFPSLRELHLDGNQLEGEIPQGIGQLSMLEKFDVSANTLEGTLTHRHFLKLSRLRELYLFDNKRLAVCIDSSWIPPFQLDVIALRSCKLGPSFPMWLQMQNHFSYLDVSNAGISDSVPTTFWNSLSSKLGHLDMSHNQLYGSIPNLTFKSEYLMNIDLSFNRFEGDIPSRFTGGFSLYLNDNRFSDASYILCPETELLLEELNLSNNLLSGTLPDCWMNFDHLSSLHLENNRFSGDIPKSIGTLQNLQYLHLSNNTFSGSLPESLENCTSLLILNLGYNSFTGYIPPWFGTAFQKLGALILRNNNFLGELPLTLCQLSDLQILDLAFNHISGTIPKCIYNLTLMGQNTGISLYFDTYVSNIGYQPVSTEHESAIVTWKNEEQMFKNSLGLVKLIDLSYNQLHGRIPVGISRLVGLVSLDLSGNSLSGNIPSEIGNLTGLELLDLSHNHLTGGIPVSLTKVTSLGIFDVSNNNLSGEIPLSTQLQSFDAVSYTGNPGLCGAPLPKCPTDHTPSNVLINTDEGDNLDVFPGLYISVVLGVIVGFWAFCGTLVIKTSWRHAYFRLLGDIKAKVLCW